MELLTNNDNAVTVVGKLNDDFTELASGTACTPERITDTMNAPTFCNTVNINMSNIKTALNAAEALHPVSAEQFSESVLANINADLSNLHVAQSGGGGDIPTPDTNEKIKVLFLGNSFTVNSVGYLPFILNNYGVNFKVAYQYAAGSTLESYVGYFDSYNGKGTPINTYQWDSDSSSSWSVSSMTPAAILTADSWDLVVIQQASKESINSESYGFAESLIAKIDSVMQGEYSIGWNVNHCRASHNNPLAVLSNIQSTIAASANYEHSIDVVLPYGTAIFNALTIQAIRSLHSGGTCRNLRAGGNDHLPSGYPMYLASLTIAQALFNYFSLNKSIANDNTMLSADYTNSSSSNYKNIPANWGSFMDLDDANAYSRRQIAIDAATAAVESPLSVTQLNEEVISITYNLTGCSVEGIQVTSVSYGDGISISFVPDTGKTMSLLKWNRDWLSSSGASIDLTESTGNGSNGIQFQWSIDEDVVTISFTSLTDNIIITATATE